MTQPTACHFQTDITTVATAGTAQQLSADPEPVGRITLRGTAGNTGNIGIGKSDVTMTSASWILTPGESITLTFAPDSVPLSDFFVDATNSGDKLDWIVGAEVVTSGTSASVTHAASTGKTASDHASLGNMDFAGNAIDNAGFIILNTATQPAGSEVHVVHDNSGDLTLNAKDTKTVNVAVNKVDQMAIGASTLTGNVVGTGGSQVAVGNHTHTLQDDVEGSGTETNSPDNDPAGDWNLNRSIAAGANLDLATTTDTFASSSRAHGVGFINAEFSNAALHPRLFMAGVQIAEVTPASTSASQSFVLTGFRAMSGSNTTLMRVNNTSGGALSLLMFGNSSSGDLGAGVAVGSIKT